MIEYPGIDMNRLEKEWDEVGGLIEGWVKKVAHASFEVDQAKDKKELVYSEIEDDIRQNPESYNMTKTTDKAVEGAIPRQKLYKEVQQEYNTAKLKLRLVTGTYEKYKDRKQALENIVKLWLGSYFSTPYCDNKEFMEKVERDRQDRAFGTKKRKKDDS